MKLPATNLYAEIARSHPSLLGGIVICARCGKSRIVDAAHCLQHGWPKCCEATMSLADTKERKSK